MLVESLKSFLMQELSINDLQMSLMNYQPRAHEINYHSADYRVSQVSLIDLICKINYLIEVYTRYPINQSLDSLFKKNIISNPCLATYDAYKKILSIENMIPVETINPILTMLNGRITITSFKNQWSFIDSENGTNYNCAVTCGTEVYTFEIDDFISICGACNFILDIFIDYVKTQYTYLTLKQGLTNGLIISDSNDVDEAIYFFKVNDVVLSNNAIIFNANRVVLDNTTNKFFDTGYELKGYASLNFLGEIEFSFINFKNSDDHQTVFNILVN